MGLTQQHTQAWKFLKAQAAKVADPDLRMSMMAEFRKRALNEWGFNPDNGQLAADDEFMLSAWEQSFLADIQKTTQYELDVRADKRESELHEARSRMRHFVEHGGCLKDIPENIRTPFVEQLFYEALFWYGDQLMEACNATSNR